MQRKGALETEFTMERADSASSVSSDHGILTSTDLSMGRETSTSLAKDTVAVVITTFNHAHF